MFRTAKQRKNVATTANSSYYQSLTDWDKRRELVAKRTHYTSFEETFSCPTFLCKSGHLMPEPALKFSSSVLLVFLFLFAFQVYNSMVSSVICLRYHSIKEGVSKNFRTGRLEQELQMVQLSVNSCSCIAILWVSLVSFAAITLCVASQQVVPNVSVYFFMTQSGNFWIHPRKYSCSLTSRIPN
jgi:hypothetical protein